jgi:hypothetical protein
MDPTSDFSMVWTAEEIKRVGYEVIDLIAEYLTSLADRPVFIQSP